MQSAPVIQDASPVGEISGSFTQQSADDLANVLKYGALPLTFNRVKAQTISATLGKAVAQRGPARRRDRPRPGHHLLVHLLPSPRRRHHRVAGDLRLAGLRLHRRARRGHQLHPDARGYRRLHRGRRYHRRLVRRLLRTAERRGPRGPDGAHQRRASWVRARRTILSADTVSFLAAATLYYLSIGSVRGFAFTLGLSTLLDLVVVFLFTKPVVTLLVRRPLFSTSRYERAHARRPWAPRSKRCRCRSASAAPAGQARRTGKGCRRDVGSRGSSVSSDREGS